MLGLSERRSESRGGRQQDEETAQRNVKRSSHARSSRRWRKSSCSRSDTSERACVTARSDATLPLVLRLALRRLRPRHRVVLRRRHGLRLPRAAAVLHRRAPRLLRALARGDAAGARDVRVPLHAEVRARPHHQPARPDRRRLPGGAARLAVRPALHLPRVARPAVHAAGDAQVRPPLRPGRRRRPAGGHRPVLGLDAREGVRALGLPRRGRRRGGAAVRAADGRGGARRRAPLPQPRVDPALDRRDHVEVLGALVLAPRPDDVLQRDLRCARFRARNFGRAIRGAQFGRSSAAQFCAILR